MPKLNDCLETHNLLDLIKNRAKNIRKDFVTNPHAQHIESELNFIILCAEKVLNNGWISIDDDTPKIKGRYLCYYPKSDKQAVEPFMLDDMLNNKEYMKALGISHWQSTPPNPTKE